MLKERAPVAQLDRVFGYELKGRGFESLQARSFNKVKNLSLRKFETACTKGEHYSGCDEHSIICDTRLKVRVLV